MARRWASNGFTIVELLIVIVVIAILAAITVVAFNGVQNRAHDSAVQNDLRNFGVQLKAYAVDNSNSYPVGGTGGQAATMTAIDSFEPVNVTIGSYDRSTFNFYYCTGLVNGVQEFAAVAKSKSGTIFTYSSIDGARVATGTSWGGAAAGCDGTSVPRSSVNFTYKFGFSSATRYAWIKQA